MNFYFCGPALTKCYEIQETYVSVPVTKCSCGDLSRSSNFVRLHCLQAVTAASRYQCNSVHSRLFKLFICYTSFYTYGISNFRLNCDVYCVVNGPSLRGSHADITTTFHGRESRFCFICELLLYTVFDITAGLRRFLNIVQNTCGVYC